MSLYLNYKTGLQLLLVLSFFRVQKTDTEQVLEANDGSGILDEDEEDLQRALALSRQQIDMEDEEADLRRAIQLSMQGTDILAGFCHC